MDRYRERYILTATTFSFYEKKNQNIMLRLTPIELCALKFAAELAAILAAAQIRQHLARPVTLADARCGQCDVYAERGPDQCPDCLQRRFIQN